MGIDKNIALKMMQLSLFLHMQMVGFPMQRFISNSKVMYLYLNWCICIFLYCYSTGDGQHGD